MLRHLIAPFALIIALALFNAPSTYAVGIGLPDDSYNLSVDFPGMTYDATGTVTISGGLVTDFHVDTNITLGHFDCGTSDCAQGGSDPDQVPINNAVTPYFYISDTSGVGATYHTLNIGADNTARLDTYGGAIISDGVWDASPASAPVPESSSAMLTIFGLFALGVLSG